MDRSPACPDSVAPAPLAARRPLGRLTGRLPLLGPILLLGWLVAACGPNPHVVRGTQAELEGDWLEAVQAYRDAVADDPDDEEARFRLARAELHLRDTTVDAVARLVAADDYPAALAEVAAALALLPNDPDLGASRESVRRAGVDYYRRQLELGEERTAYEGARLLAGSFPDDPETSALLNEAEGHYAELLRTRANEAEAADLDGLALAYWTVHQTFSPSGEAGRRAAALRSAIDEQIVFRYRIELGGVLADRSHPGLAGVLAREVAPGTGEATPDEHAEDAESVDARIVASLTEPVIHQSEQTQVLVQPYLAGYQEVQNPRYLSLQRDVTGAERRVLDAEGEVLRREEALHHAEVERDRHAGQSDYATYYDRWDRAARDLQRAREALQDERERLYDRRQRLGATPMTVLQELWIDYPYEVYDYTRQAVATYRASIYHARGLDREVTETLYASTTDRVHDAHPTIGLARDPLAFPLTDAELAVGVQDQALALVRAALRERFDLHREHYESHAVNFRQRRPDLATDYSVRAVLLAPDEISEAARGWLQQAVGLDDPRLLIGQ